MLRATIVPLLLVLLAGCGGGGGGGGGSPNNPQPSDRSVAYVVGANNRLSKIDLDAKRTEVISSAFNGPVGVAVTNDASFAYVYDIGTSLFERRVSEVNLGDSSIRRLGSFSNLRGIAVGASGAVYLSVENQLLKLNPTDGTTVPVTSALAQALNVVIDAAETTAYVLDNTNTGGQLVRVDIDTGTTSAVASIAIAADFPPNGLALSPDERYGVTHGFSDSDLIRVELATGQVTSIPVNTACLANALMGAIDFDSDESVLVADSDDCLTQVNIADSTSIPLGDGSSYGMPGSFLGLYGIVTK